MMADMKADFQFIDHKIKRLEINNDFSDLVRKLTYNLSLEVTDTPAIEENEQGDFVGSVSLTVKVVGKSSEQDDRCISVVLELEGGFFASKDDMSLEVFNKMLQLNGLTTMYSIARSIIISVSAQCCPNGQVRLPMLNMVEVRNAMDEAAESEDTLESAAPSASENGNID